MRRTLCLLLLLLTSTYAQEDPVERARREFPLLAESTSLLWDASALRRWIGLEGDDVLPRLIELYVRELKPDPHFSYLVASCIRARYDAEHRPFRPIGGTPGFGPIPAAELEALTAMLREDTEEERDAWAVFQLCSVLSRRQVGTDALLHTALRDRETVRRVAAIEALGRAGDTRFALRIPELLADKWPRKKHERAFLVESLAWAASDWARPRLQPAEDAEVGEAERVTALELLTHVARQLDDEKHQERSLRQVRLALQAAVGSERAYEDSASWELLFNDLAVPVNEGEERTVVRFMGIETDGTRIIFLLDASDSMLKPLTEAEKTALEDLFQGEMRRADEDDTEDRSDPLRIDWESVGNRFDAAREHLRWTLSQMDEDVYFAVLLFGDEAEALEVTPYFVQATRKRKRLVARALDAIEIGEKASGRPHGTLRGQTNLRSAFDLAFRVGKGGIVPQGTPLYTDKAAFFEGLDTLFLLSDGKPTRDGFSGITPVLTTGGYWREAGERTITDPETGAKRKVKHEREFIPERTQRHNHGNGPYVGADALLEELTRLNLFRKAVFHAIAIGEAERSLPEQIARLGRGRWLALELPEE